MSSGGGISTYFSAPLIFQSFHMTCPSFLQSSTKTICGLQVCFLSSKTVSKKEITVRKAQKMGSNVESGVMADLRIGRIFRIRDMVKNTSEIIPKSLAHIA